MNKSQEDLSAEREAALEAVSSIPFCKPWAFETEPASPQGAEDAFLEGVRGSAFFVLILGKTLTQPVKKEYLFAATNRKAVFIFAKEAQERSEEVETLLESASVKYDSFESASDLSNKCRRALEKEIIRRVTDATPMGDTRISNVLLDAQRLKSKGERLRVRPIVPPKYSSREFSIESISIESINLGALNTQLIVIPPSKVRGVFRTQDGNLMELDGRLQATHPQMLWKFFAEAPDLSNPLGFVQFVSRDGISITQLRARLESAGYELTSVWRPGVAEKESEGWEVYYDEEGHYLAFQDYTRSGVEQAVFMVRKK